MAPDILWEWDAITKRVEQGIKITDLPGIVFQELSIYSLRHAHQTMGQCSALILALLMVQIEINIS